MRNGLWDLKSVLRGFLSGSLVVGSIINPAGIASVMIFLIGIYAFIDTLFPYGKNSYPVLTVVFFIIGSFVVLFFTFSGWVLPYMAAIIVVTIIMYISKIRSIRSLR